MMRILSITLPLLILLGCDASPPGSSPTATPTSQPSAADDRITAMVEVEELTEQVANRLIEFSGAVLRRDFSAALEYLDPSFVGTPLAAFKGWESAPIARGVVERRLGEGFPDGVDRDLFLASIEARLDALTRIDRVFFKTRGAEFSEGRSRGEIELTVQIIGTRADGAILSFLGWAKGTVQGGEGSAWRVGQFTLERAREQVSAAPLLVEVSRSAGLAQRAPRFGDAENRSYYWRGAASEDIDGDGLFDVLVSSAHRAFLYRNRGDGTFDEIAAQVGLEDLAGMTSPLLFDVDRDGDLDLFAARVGWTRDGVPAGQSLVLRRNDGGKFVDITRAAGLERYVNAFTAVAFDHDLDGYLDLYVCGYGRLDAEYPNSWHRATNGQPNLLLRNVDGTRFEEIGAAAGIADRSWSYAAAAADYDEDGDIDLAVANDYGVNALYRNRGDGTYEDIAEEVGLLDVGNGMGAAWGDLDQDGRLDLYISNMSSSAGNRILERFADRSRSETEGVLYKLAAGNSIFLQRENGFERLDPSAGGIGASWAWGASLLDLDLDGDLDIYVANGFISGDSLKDT